MRRIVSPSSLRGDLNILNIFVRDCLHELQSLHRSPWPSNIGLSHVQVGRKSEIEGHEILRKVRLGYRRATLPVAE